MCPAGSRLKKNRKQIALLIGVQSSLNALEVVGCFWREMNLYPAKSVSVATVIGSE